MSDIKTCTECNPPKADTDSPDHWQCPGCSVKFRLDRETRIWWPEAWWDQKSVVLQPLEGDR